MKENDVQYLFFSSGTLVLFMMALVGGKRFRVGADYIFLGWLLLIFLNLLAFYIVSSPVIPVQGWVQALVLFCDLSLFLHGPFFWLYTCSLTRPFFRLEWKDSLHLLPFMAGLAYKLLMSSGVESSGEILLLIQLLSLLGYTIAVLRQLRMYRHTIRDIFSNTEEKYLGWLQFLSWGLLFLWFLSVVGILASFVTRISLSYYENDPLHVVASLFIIAMCYFAIRQTPIIYSRILPEEQDAEEPAELPEDRADAEEEPEEKKSIKYRKSGLGGDQSARLYARLLEVMERDRPYLDADLTLFSLAAILNWPANHLSQVINTHEQKNFFDFVNGYRIEAIKQRIRSGQYEHLTLLSIAYECGFNSKAAFNRAFKKITGLTPSAFRKGGEEVVILKDDDN